MGQALILVSLFNYEYSSQSCNGALHSSPPLQGDHMWSCCETRIDMGSEHHLAGRNGMTSQNPVRNQSARDARADRILTCQIPSIKDGWPGQEFHTIPASIMPVGGPIGPHCTDRTQALLASSTCHQGQVIPTLPRTEAQHCKYVDIPFTIRRLTHHKRTTIHADLWSHWVRRRFL